jgi:hypothetical protein
MISAEHTASQTSSSEQQHAFIANIAFSAAIYVHYNSRLQNINMRTASQTSPSEQQHEFIANIAFSTATLVHYKYLQNSNMCTSEILLSAYQHMCIRNNGFGTQTHLHLRHWFQNASIRGSQILLQCKQKLLPCIIRIYVAST